MLVSQINEILRVDKLIEVAKHPLQQQEGVKVLMVPPWGIVEHAEALLLHHLIVADVEVPGVENGGVEVEDLLPAVGSLELAEVLLGEVDELLVLDGACADDDHVLAEVHTLVVVNDHLAGDLSDVLDLAEDGQAHHVVAIHVEVDVFHESFEVIIVCGLELLVNGVLLNLHMIMVVLRIAEHVSEDVHRVGHIVLEGKHVIQSELTARVCIELIALVLNLGFQRVSVSAGGALEVKVLQEMGLAGVLHLFVAGSRVDEHSNRS
jgi:hypothetical protein